LFCCLICFFSRFFLCFSKTFATRFMAAKPRTMLCIFTAEAMNGCSAGSSLVLLTVGDFGLRKVSLGFGFLSQQKMSQPRNLSCNFLSKVQDIVSGERLGRTFCFSSFSH
jgi:hypothetical protein